MVYDDFVIWDNSFSSFLNKKWLTRPKEFYLRSNLHVLLALVVVIYFDVKFYESRNTLIFVDETII